MLLSDRDGDLLCYNLSFDEVYDPSVDWFSKHAMIVLEGSLDEGNIPKESLAASVVFRPDLLGYCRFLVRGTVKEFKVQHQLQRPLAGFELTSSL